MVALYADVQALLLPRPSMALERLSLSVEMEGHRACAKKQQNLVPGARIELATPAFSGRRSTNELPRQLNFSSLVAARSRVNSAKIFPISAHLWSTSMESHDGHKLEIFGHHSPTRRARQVRRIRRSAHEIDRRAPPRKTYSPQLVRLLH